MPDLLRADAYPTASSRAEIHFTGDGGYVMVGGEAADGSRVFTEHFETDTFFLRFLELADGTRSCDHIGRIFTDELGPLFGPTLAVKALDAATSGGLCTVEGRPSEIRGGVGKVTGSAGGYHPVHATVEIIETCNFTCDHCYFSASPSKKGRLPLDRALQLLDLLAERGVRTIELTGGECTIHPDFPEILRAASERFLMVAVISNGWLLGTRPELRDYVASFDNVVVQVSIDGLEDHHDRWRRRPGSFAAGTRAIRELSALGVAVRMACTLSEQNVHQVGDLFRLGKSLGAAVMAFAPVAALGRGCNVTEPGLGADGLVRAIEEQLRPYADDVTLRQGPAPKTIGTGAAPRNCGAGSRTYAVNYDGEVRACNFSRDSKKFGNLFTDDYGTVFEQEATFLFRNAPSPGGAECVGCDYYHYCRGCFVKAFMTSEHEYPGCPWRQKWFPGMSLDLAADRGPVRRTLPLLVEPPSMDFHDCGCGH